LGLVVRQLCFLFWVAQAFQPVLHSLKGCATKHLHRPGAMLTRRLRKHAQGGREPVGRVPPAGAMAGVLSGHADRAITMAANPDSIGTAMPVANNAYVRR